MSAARENYFRYIPVRQRDVQWGLYVTGAGCGFIPPGQPYPPKSHPESVSLSLGNRPHAAGIPGDLHHRGGGPFRVGPHRRQANLPGTIILLFPGVWHRYRPQPETGWQEYWVSFNGEVMDRLVEQKFFSPDQAVIATGLQDVILAPYQSLLGRLRGEQTGFPHLIAADTQEILAAVSAAAECEPAELIAQGPQDVVAVKDRMVAETMRLIWEQSQGPMTVDHLSRQLPITRASLERRFRAAVGHGIHDEIVRCRLERAKRLLVGTDLSLKEVASAAGFISADNLGRTFRRAEGTTPLKYRRRHRR